MLCIFCNEWVIATFSIGFIATIIYLWSTWSFDYFKYKGIDFIPPDPFFGNIKGIATQKESLFDALTRLYHAFPQAK